MIKEEAIKDIIFQMLKSKDYNVMTDGKNVFDQPLNNSFKTYDNIRKVATGQGDDYTTGCLLDYIYFNDCGRFK